MSSRAQLAVMYELPDSTFYYHPNCIVVGSEAGESIFRKLIRSAGNVSVRELHHGSVSKPAVCYDRDLGNEFLELSAPEAGIHMIYDAYRELGAIFFGNIASLSPYYSDLLPALKGYHDAAEFYTKGTLQERKWIEAWNALKAEEERKLAACGISLAN